MVNGYHPFATPFHNQYIPAVCDHVYDCFDITDSMLEVPPGFEHMQNVGVRRDGITLNSQGCVFYENDDDDDVESLFTRISNELNYLGKGLMTSFDSIGTESTNGSEDE